MKGKHWAWIAGGVLLVAGGLYWFFSKNTVTVNSDLP